MSPTLVQKICTIAQYNIIYYKYNTYALVHRIKSIKLHMSHDSLSAGKFLLCVFINVPDASKAVHVLYVHLFSLSLSFYQNTTYI